MRQRLRAPLAAAVALLVGGDLAARGPAGLLDVRRFLFPYLWIFLGFEIARRARLLLDSEAFLLGAAAGLVHDGIYAKTLQSGVALLGIDWPAAALSAFDWGMLTVVALHVADARMPRREDDSGTVGGRLAGTAVFSLISSVALFAYLFDTATGRYRFERMLGPEWLLADLLFASAAAALVRWAFARARAEEPEGRDSWLPWLSAFCLWIPGAQALARAGLDWPSPLTASLVAAWGACVVWGVSRLRLARGRVDPSPRRAAPAVLALGAWRLIGAALVCLIAGPLGTDARAASAFSLLVDLPTRFLFVHAFLTSRLKI